MELYRYLSILRRRIVLVVASVILGIIAGWGISPHSATYAATSTVYVGTTRFNTPDNQNYVSFDRLAALDRILLTYSVMVRSEPIAAAAAQRIPLNRSSGISALYPRSCSVKGYIELAVFPAPVAPMMMVPVNKPRAGMVSQ